MERGIVLLHFHLLLPLHFKLIDLHINPSGIDGRVEFQSILTPFVKRLELLSVLLGEGFPSAKHDLFSENPCPNVSRDLVFWYIHRS